MSCVKPTTSSLNNRMIYTRCYVVLPVADVAEAIGYYRDVLGFSSSWTEADRFGMAGDDTIAVFFEKRDTFEPVTVILNTEDADERFKTLTRNGAEIIEPIATRYWGMREVVVSDLNGHRLRIGHVDESESDFSEFDHE